jgi:hypothetical protein
VPIATPDSRTRVGNISPYSAGQPPFWALVHDPRHQDPGEEDQRVRADRDGREVGEHQRAAADRADDEDRLAADPGREPRAQRDRDQRHGVHDNRDPEP